MRIPLLSAILCIACLCGLNPAKAVSLPPGGESLLNPDALTRKWAFYPGKHQNEPLADAELLQVAHPDFQQAMRVNVMRPNGQFYNGAINLPANQAVSKGETLVIQLYFRSIRNIEESGKAFATVFAQGPKPKYKKYLIREITADSEWQKYTLPFIVTDDLAEGELSLFIGAGGGSKPQTWEVGGIELLNFGDLDPSLLPQSQASYAGREPNASWRVAANERIERYRKGDFRIQILNTAGEPLKSATIEMQQQGHAYHFGSVITAALLTGDSKDSEIYRQKVLELFNQSGTENDLKWGPWANEWGNKYQKAQTIEALQWLKAHDFYTRGHVLVWPSKKHLPKKLQPYLSAADLESTDPVVKQMILDHITDIATATADSLDEWDVINEPYSNHDLMDAFGDEVMVDWFKAARQHLPTQGLYLNDFGILSGGGRDLAHHRDFENTLRYLMDKGAPLTGMGMQGHFSGTPTPINKIYQILEHFHSSFPQLDIRITEFDMQTEDTQLQADFTRDLLTIAFSHPATVGVQCWGFWEGAHWRPECAMYTKDWKEKPNAQIWKQLTREVWWTTLSGNTDSNGSFSGRAFYGDYSLRVTHMGKVQERHFSLREDAKNDIKIQL